MIVCADQGLERGWLVPALGYSSRSEVRCLDRVAAVVGLWRLLLPETEAAKEAEQTQ